MKTNHKASRFSTTRRRVVTSVGALFAGMGLGLGYSGAASGGTALDFVKDNSGAISSGISGEWIQIFARLLKAYFYYLTGQNPLKDEIKRMTIAMADQGKLDYLKTVSDAELKRKLTPMVDGCANLAMGEVGDKLEFRAKQHDRDVVAAMVSKAASGQL